MEHRYFKDVLSCVSIITAELIAYPISTEITRAQSKFSINVRSLKSSYAGAATTVMSAPTLILKLKLVDYLVEKFRKEANMGDFTSLITASAACEAIGSFIRCPSEILRQQFQVEAYKRYKHATYDMLGYRGVRGFFRGYSVFFMRDFSFNTMRYALLLDLAGRSTRNRGTKGQNQNWINVQATIPVAVVTTMFDTVKTRIMTQPFYYNHSAWYHFKEIVFDEGFFNLFRAAGLRALQLSILISMYTTIYNKLLAPLEPSRKIIKSFKDPFRQMDQFQYIQTQWRAFDNIKMIVSTSGFSLAEKVDLGEKILTLDGKYDWDLHYDVDVLVANNVMHPKYKACIEQRIPVVSKKWLYDWEKAGEFIEPNQSRYKLPIFNGCVFYLFTQSEKEQIRIEKHGGKVCKSINNTTTHCLINSKSSLSFSNFPGALVDNDWVTSCIKYNEYRPPKISSRILKRQQLYYLDRLIVAFSGLTDTEETIQKEIVVSGGGTFTNNWEYATHIISSRPMKHPRARIVNTEWLKCCSCDLKVLDCKNYQDFE